jgi:hypothetical protein
MEITLRRITKSAVSFKMQAILSAMLILSGTTLFSEGGVLVAKNQSVTELNKLKGIRATIEPTDSALDGAVEISIEMDLKNEFFDDTSKVDFVLTLIDENGRFLCNFPVDGFKEVHSKPGQEMGYHSLKFTVRKNLLEKSRLVFHDTSRTAHGGDGTIHHVHFNDTPQKEKS